MYWLLGWGTVEGRRSLRLTMDGERLRKGVLYSRLLDNTIMQLCNQRRRSVAIILSFKIPSLNLKNYG